MKVTGDPKFVLVTRPTRLTELIRRFNTLDQAQFYVEHLGADFSDYLKEDQTYREALAATETILARHGRLQVVDRTYLANFVFAPQDIVVVLGQDGLVANTLKYLEGQPVLGINPDPQRWDGQLLPFNVKNLPKILPEFLSSKRPLKTVTMAQATLNNGLFLCAVNDLFIGPRSHGSARYCLDISGQSEHQSSSGIIVSTGMGSTGWFKSLMTGANAVAEKAHQLLVSDDEQDDAFSHFQTRNRIPNADPTTFPWDSEHLFFTVREPFPTRTTGASLVFGKITRHEPLRIISEMPENGVIFSDGMEKDFLEFNSGTQAVISLAKKQGCLVT